MGVDTDWVNACMTTPLCACEYLLKIVPCFIDHTTFQGDYLCVLSCLEYSRGSVCSGRHCHPYTHTHSQDAMSSAQEVQLSGDKLGESVDECDALLKKHEAFERLMQSQEEKVCEDVRV